MSWFDRFKSQRDNRHDPALSGSDGRTQHDAGLSDAERLAQWEEALQKKQLPPFVKDRLTAAATGKTPWLATMTPVELLTARSHGMQPIAMVSGTCWYHYGFSWTKGHAAGWQTAIKRMQMEAAAAGANAIVDVRMRKISMEFEASMDFTVIGTAVRIKDLPPSPNPIVATVDALEFVRLLEADIVPAGIAIGAHYEWLNSWNRSLAGQASWYNQPLTQLGHFWESVRRRAMQDLRNSARSMGNGILAHTHFGQLVEAGDERNRSYLGRHIVVGTVVDCKSMDSFHHAIRPVVDMCDGESPLLNAAPNGHNVYATNEEEGSI
jgi:uncharacterized protein YbjQ (UPF0145 family)